MHVHPPAPARVHDHAHYPLLRIEGPRSIPTCTCMTYIYIQKFNLHIHAKLRCSTACSFQAQEKVQLFPLASYSSLKPHAANVIARVYNISVMI